MQETFRNMFPAAVDQPRLTSNLVPLQIQPVLQQTEVNIVHGGESLTIDGLLWLSTLAGTLNEPKKLTMSICL